MERGLGGEAKNLDEKNDLEFAKFLASLGECFVYDAFSVGHRDHASTTGIAKILPSCFGPTFLREYNSLKKITDELGSSLVFMGGAKLSTKLPIIQKFLNGGAVVCVGGAMLHPILQAQNIDIKDSYLEKDFELDKKDLDYLLGEIGQADQKKNLILPKELIWNKESAAEKDRNKIVDNIFDFESINKIILDNNIKNILWNGPVGMYEQGNVTGSREIYKFIKDKKTPITPLSQLRQGYAGQTQRGEDSKLFTVIGGGDTITFLEEEQKIENVNSEINTDKENVAKSFEKDFSYVSLSGGAMLEFLSTGTLPILESVKI